MSEVRRWFLRALFAMDLVVRQVPDDAWDRPSPCAGWSGRDVLGHVLATHHFYVSCIEGRPPPMDPMTDPGRHAGDRPAAAWATARDAVLEALDRPGVIESVVHAPDGPTRVEDLIRFNIVDTTVHAWDLARAAGVDDRLDAALAARCRRLLEEAGHDVSGGSAVDGFGPAVAVVDGDDQARLLAATGRRP